MYLGTCSSINTLLWTTFFYSFLYSVLFHRCIHANKFVIIKINLQQELLLFFSLLIHLFICVALHFFVFFVHIGSKYLINTQLYNICIQLLRWKKKCVYMCETKKEIEIKWSCYRSGSLEMGRRTIHTIQTEINKTKQLINCNFT